MMLISHSHGHVPRTTLRCRGSTLLGLGSTLLVGSLTRCLPLATLGSPGLTFCFLSRTLFSESGGALGAILHPPLGIQELASTREDASALLANRFGHRCEGSRDLEGVHAVHEIFQSHAVFLAGAVAIVFSLCYLEPSLEGELFVRVEELVPFSKGHWAAPYGRESFLTPE